ncbi:putative amino acid racemase [Desulfosporosinus acidiphilus SJ4]|uniref:Putative amino acid racemase n=1 Tax=Desulfosporosinus acidiphilus (strain DSM 22704 / JCM 16185 / SJ4) TaxID=646529 RepID=I4D4Y2_DESAJ|nr:alanine/ornithine racemase family PLP-dependent enzyme [Desulfosporosinus acidiphilus]AFM40856.1 putative amino acid racemase [Desulfosporosinus acidiphilus SJ4]
MSLPEIVINLTKITKNVDVLKRIADPYQVEVVGVTKVFSGESKIAAAMLAGGIRMLADSRLENLAHLKKAFPDTPLMLLRLPGLSQVDETVILAEVSLNSNWEVLQALSQAALRYHKTHRVILMVEMGDLREGIWPEELSQLVSQVLRLKGLILEGLGVNLACYGGVIPTPENLGQLVELAEGVEKEFGISLPVISGGNSASLSLLQSGKVPARINQLRIGEGIVLGCETVNRQPLPGAFSDAFILRAEILESYDKPTVPLGSIGQDAFGEIPKFTDEGWRKRGIIALGRQDVPTEGLILRDERLRIFGASSDHLIVDVTGAPELSVGSVVEFNLNYRGLLGAMTSPFVHKRYIN